MVVGRVSLLNLGHADGKGQSLAIGPDRHVGEPQEIADPRLLIGELGQLRAQAELLSLGRGAGVERNEVHDPLGERPFAEESGAVERVEAEHREVGGVPHVVEPGRADQNAGVFLAKLRGH